MAVLNACGLFQGGFKTEDRMSEADEPVTTILTVRCWLFQDGLDTDDRLTEEDESLMVALSVATAVGLLFMVLGLVFWRRNRRRNLYYYRTEGYGKVRLLNSVFYL